MGEERIEGMRRKTVGEKAKWLVLLLLYGRCEQWYSLGVGSVTMGSIRCRLPRDGTHRYHRHWLKSRKGLVIEHEWYV
jgi:hypothetical protein